MNVTEMARTGLTGVRGKAIHKVSGPIARKTPLSRAQVEAIAGAVFLVLATTAYLRLLRNVWQARDARTLRLDQ
jgi:hypothetical protein